ncbi:MAG: excalibur calcium-binding domain-containing protein [Sphingomonadales bacterium]
MRRNDPKPGTYFNNCDEVRTAGVAPLAIGEPGYRSPLDEDGDGVACEPYGGTI